MNRGLIALLIYVTAGLLAGARGQAFPVEIERHAYGSGEPGQAGFENALAVENNIYHVPQYLAGYPTARTLWPRVVEVPCTSVSAVTRCRGYNWTPAMGRSEYLYFRPVPVEPATPGRPTSSAGPANPVVAAQPSGAKRGPVRVPIASNRYER
ncbi:MAG: hypothetical protein JWP22_2924 [Ramlibacter sp.]|nr:hypothetical protein [Ramlibacter sp.]